MRVVLQRVTRASVVVDSSAIAAIGPGLLVLLGVANGDGERDVQYVVDKCLGLRLFGDAEGKMNRSIQDVQGALLIVSQFTLLADTKKGRRPGFDAAAPPDIARRLYEQVVGECRGRGISVETGRFGAHMVVSLDNDGPVTLLLDSRD